MNRKIVYPDAGEGLAPIFSGARLAKLESLGDFEIYYDGRPDDDTFIERLRGAQAAISGWGMSNRVLAALPELEIISFTGLGASNFIDIAEANRLGITVTHTLSAAVPVSEHTMGLMLDAAKHISRFDRETRQGGWRERNLQGMDLHGKKLGLIGFGRIAQAVVPLAKAFGMRVNAWTRNPDRERAERFGIEFIELDDLLGTSDVVSLHLLSNAETAGLLNANRLRSLKPGAILINTARSQILDESAMVELLETGHIGAAGIDVFDTEPVPAHHPLFKLDNVVVTPHVAYNTPAAKQEMYDTAVDNLMAFYAGSKQNIATI